MSDEKRPPGLSACGRRLWDTVLAKYVLTPAEIAMLSEACRTTDELDRLERVVRASSELLVSGSMGQQRAHPLLAEVRAHRRTLERLCAALALPADVEIVGVRPASAHARKAAQSRWQRAAGNS